LPVENICNTYSVSHSVGIEFSGKVIVHITNQRRKLRGSRLAILMLIISLPLSIVATAQQKDGSLTDNDRFQQAVAARSPFLRFDGNGTDLKLIETLLSENHISTELKDSALASAATYGDAELVRLLIANGADVNYREERKRQTVLMLAAFLGFYVECGNDPLVTSYGGNTEIIKSLLDAGARINEQDDEGNTALMLASRCARNHNVKLLLEAGANVDVQNRYGWTALIYAANSNGSYNEANLIEIIKGLLAAGATVNVRDQEGKTALNYAVRSLAITELLLSAGAVK
jgi:ankyrin repeat protein